MLQQLEELFKNHVGKAPEKVEELSSSGSNRRYFRLSCNDFSLVGVIGTNKDENKAFCKIDEHFLTKGINVPRVVAISDDYMTYLQEDLGNDILYKLLENGRMSGEYSSYEKQLLIKTIEMLPKIQFAGADGLDFDNCYPQPAFNRRLVMFDLNYFKYCFLKASGLDFNEVKLQEDFEKLADELVKDEGNTFMYRDFQSRNVMRHDNEPYFIDFQGGMRGPIYYDVASFIWQARSRYPEDLKMELVDKYIKALGAYMEVDKEEFMSRLRLFVLFRSMQVLGAYGFRGYFEKKPHFLQSVPFAMENLRRLLAEPFEEYPYLSETLKKLANMRQFYDIVKDDRLSVKIYSFSYKKGIPADNSGNGGGYVFDCRSINNPGKYEHYKKFTGMDQEVIKFFEEDGEIFDFLDHVYGIVDHHVKRFIERKFTNLMVSFGCTGGQHRSVYSAEQLGAYLSKKYDVKVTIIHREQNIEKIL